MQKNYLTNEALKKHFKSNFELAQYVIRAARYFIRSGHEIRVADLMRDVQKHPGQYDLKELIAMEKSEEETEDDVTS